MFVNVYVVQVGDDDAVVNRWIGVDGRDVVAGDARSVPNGILGHFVHEVVAVLVGFRQAGEHVVEVVGPAFARLSSDQRPGAHLVAAAPQADGDVGARSVPGGVVLPVLLHGDVDRLDGLVARLHLHGRGGRRAIPSRDGDGPHDGVVALLGVDVGLGVGQAVERAHDVVAASVAVELVVRHLHAYDVVGVAR